MLFSIITFSISKLTSQWKETAKFRKARREMRNIEKVLCKMSAKELLDAAKIKDKEGYDRLIKHSDINIVDESQKIFKKEKIKKEKKSKLVKEAKVESNAKNF